MTGRNFAGLLLLFASFLFCERADIFEIASREHPIRLMYSTDNISFYYISGDVHFPDAPVAANSQLYFKVVNISAGDVYLVGTPPGTSILVFDDPVFGPSPEISLTLGPGASTSAIAILFSPTAAGEFKAIGTIPYQETGDLTVWVYSFRAGGTGIP